MDGLVTLLLFAGLFYVMMRFGCGAHMVHGHGGHSGHDSGRAEHGQPPALGSSTDPVCGMAVAPGQGYTKAHAGREYRFCSRACLDKFDAKPDAYLPAA
jgi:YHS domain-containing protein